MSTHLLEIDLADRVNHLVDLAHVNGELLLSLVRGVDLKVVNELRGHRDEGLLRPWQEPVNSATAEDSRELLGTFSELSTDGGEGKHHMQVVLHSVQEVLPEDGGRWVFTFLTDFLHVDVLALHRDEILVFFTQKTWDLTSCKHRIDSLEERL